MRATLPAAVLLAALALLPPPARAGGEGSGQLTLGVGTFDIFEDPAPEAWLAYRPPRHLGPLYPRLGVLGNADGGLYAFAGVLFDLRLGRWHLMPNTAIGAWHEGGSKDLGHTLVFRSGLEIAYRLGGGARLGVGFHHVSNGGIGHSNPGAESLTLTYSLPLP